MHSFQRYVLVKFYLFSVTFFLQFCNIFIINVFSFYLHRKRKLFFFIFGLRSRFAMIYFLLYKKVSHYHHDFTQTQIGACRSIVIILIILSVLPELFILRNQQIQSVLPQPLSPSVVVHHCLHNYGRQSAF